MFIHITRVGRPLNCSVALDRLALYRKFSQIFSATRGFLTRLEEDYDQNIYVYFSSSPGRFSRLLGIISFPSAGKSYLMMMKKHTLLVQIGFGLIPPPAPFTTGQTDILPYPFLNSTE